MRKKISIYRVTGFLVLSGLLVVTLILNTAFARPILDTESDVSRNEGFALLAAPPDVVILAKETGLPLKSVERAIAFQQGFAKYAVELFIRYPNQISVVWTEPVPTTRGHVQFVVEVPPQEVAPENVVLTGGGLISMADHKRRAELAAEALVDLGHQNGLTFFDPIHKVTRIELKLPQAAPQPSKPALVDAVQRRVRSDPALQGRAAVVDAADLELAVIRGDGPIFTNQHVANARGGNWLLDAGVRECTSGWSVSGPQGDGIITAAHCVGLDQLEDPGVTPFIDMLWWNEEWGTGGDVEYHTTLHPELAEFYADAANIRAVASIRTTSTMVGNFVCVYGRSSNVRTCNHVVEAVGVSVFDSDCSCTVGNLARTDSTSTIGGDSGGGWSFNFAAWGVHKGIDGAGRGYFTPVQEAQTALNITIKTQ